MPYDVNISRDYRNVVDHMEAIPDEVLRSFMGYRVLFVGADRLVEWQMTAVARSPRRSMDRVIVMARRCWH